MDSPQINPWATSLSTPINPKTEHYSPDQTSGYLKVSDGGLRTLSFPYDTESRLLGMKKGPLPTPEQMETSQKNSSAVVGGLREVSLLTPKYSQEQRNQFHDMTRIVQEQLRFNKLGVWLTDYGFHMMKPREAIAHNTEIEKLRREVDSIFINSERTYKECQKAVEIGLPRVTGTIGRRNNGQASMAVVDQEVDKALKEAQAEGATSDKLHKMRVFANGLKLEAHKMAAQARLPENVKPPKGKEGEEALQRLAAIKGDSKQLARYCPKNEGRVKEKELDELIILIDSIMNNGRQLGEFVIRQLEKIKDEDERRKVLFSKRHYLSEIVARMPTAYEYIFHITEMKGANAAKLREHWEDQPKDFQDQQRRDRTSRKEGAWPVIYGDYCDRICELIGGKDQLPDKFAAAFKILDPKPVKEGDAENLTAE